MTIDRMNLAGIDLNLLTALDALLAEGSVSRAAERLHRSQPATSHALKRLRHLFRDPLLVRVGARMQLTSRGESLRGAVNDALGRVRDLLDGERFDPSRSTRTFRLVVSDNAGTMVLSPLLKRLANDAPMVAIRLLPPSVARFDLVELSRAIDVLVSCAPSQFKGFYQQRLFGDCDACAMRKGHPLAKRLTRKNFLTARHVAVVAREFSEDPVDTWLREEGCSRNVALTVPTYLQALHIVADSDLIAVLPEGLIRAHSAVLGIVATPVPMDAGTFDEYLLHPARTHTDAGCVWLRTLIKEVAASFDSRQRRTGSVIRTRASSRSIA
ncbi:MAG TPA: LysR family transcriptional regulator [Gemmatimonadaceae bacterium]|nr:LysR family transcriptional regulator [Gemmatimonadaceae bacterium]